ncbi:CvfB family protein [Thiosulfativibrio zosterae]|uniref:GntR family transcriptional regulator n=1 Tax=Thiosulfativibrio zosterae TaxID=2675053 RepID=A0A6F8PNU5_9GAMM|nr:S1-like domain-containing RNA-binding protein [Thiosulfativibrio zosterae]BBP43791.1 GntR family transcriptional regulator [Thiosulfativibrio zosterae]
MAQVGRINKLKIVKAVEFGVYLDGGNLGEILLPKRYMPDNAEIGQSLEVFIYLDSQDRLVATTDQPLASIGEVAFLKVTQVNKTGAFLDWGMPKDLLAPYTEQRVPMEEGRSYCVYIYEDNTGRMAASSKLSLHLSEEGRNFKRGQEVALLVASRSDLGYSAVVNGTYLGLIHNSEILQPLRMGQKLKGYIKEVRPDGKLNLSINKQGHAAVDDLSSKILAHLAENNGVSNLTDKSTPEAIFAVYRDSKANYKRSIGRLLKLKKIAIEPSQIRLLE